MKTYVKIFLAYLYLILIPSISASETAEKRNHTFFRDHTSYNYNTERALTLINFQRLSELNSQAQTFFPFNFDQLSSKKNEIEANVEMYKLLLSLPMSPQLQDLYVGLSNFLSSGGILIQTNGIYTQEQFDQNLSDGLSHLPQVHPLLLILSRKIILDSFMELTGQMPAYSEVANFFVSSIPIVGLFVDGNWRRAKMKGDKDLYLASICFQRKMEVEKPTLPQICDSKGLVRYEAPIRKIFGAGLLTVFLKNLQKIRSQSNYEFVKLSHKQMGVSDFSLTSCQNMNQIYEVYSDIQKEIRKFEDVSDKEDSLFMPSLSIWPIYYATHDGCGYYFNDTKEEELVKRLALTGGKIENYIEIDQSTGEVKH